MSTDQEFICPHRSKTNLINAPEVRKKLKGCNVPQCDYCPIAERIWVCMSCGKFACADEDHIGKHCTNKEVTGTVHSLAFSFDTLEVWCYTCCRKLVQNEWLGPTDLLKKFLDDIRNFQQKAAPVKDVPKKGKVEKAKVVHQSDLCDPLNSTSKGRGKKGAKKESEAHISPEPHTEIMQAKSKANGKPGVHVGVKGLRNLGNTCFFNSVMQCLMHTPQLEYFENHIGEDENLFINASTIMVHEKKVEVPTAIIPLDPTYSKFTLANCLKDFLAQFREYNNPNPSPLFNQICEAVPRFRGFQQQDSHELLRYLLDSLKKEEHNVWKEGVARHLRAPIYREKTEDDKVLLAKGFLEAAKLPIIDRLFGGNLLQSIQCLRCKFVSNSFEPYLDLSLPLSSCIKIPDYYKKKEVQAKHKTKKQRKEQKRTTSKRKKSTSSTYDADDEDSKKVKGLKVNGCASKSPTTSEEEDANIEIDEVARVFANLMNGVASGIDYTELLNAKRDDAGVEGTLEYALHNFLQPEKMTGANAYVCARCCVCLDRGETVATTKDRVDAMKRYVIFSPPTILTIHLKRFHQTHGTASRPTFKKLTGHISFPLKLDLAMYVSRHNSRILPNQRNIWYSLYGIVSHSGHLENGHYIAYVRRRPAMPHFSTFIELAKRRDRLEHQDSRPNIAVDADQLNAQAESYLQSTNENSQWYCVSDEGVSMVSESKALSAEAYILFYERVS